MRSLFLLCLFAGVASAQTSYPMITHVMPVAVQRGKTTRVIVSGQQNFAGVYKALFSGKGISAKVIVPAKAPALIRATTLDITVAADVTPGVREFRLASTLGMSSVGQLVISEHPVVEEKGDNNTREKANAITAPCTVAGRIETLEDVDWFKFRAKAGQTFTFDVLCARIQDKIHDLQKHADPIITLFDATGRELAANDDFFFADPLLTHTFAKEGDYYIQIRDSKYDGDPRWVYALAVSDRPHATHVFPTAVQAGKTTDLEPIGSASKTNPRIKYTAPVTPGIVEVMLPVKGGMTNPVPIIISPLPQVTETEPNDTIEKATKVTLPCGINGRIGAPRDLDHFRFTAKKGVAIRFEVKARRFGTLLRSSLDSVLDVMTLKGQVLATNDDTSGKDAAITFTPSADGDYILRIRDLNSKGGPTWVYHIEADFVRQDFTLKCDGDKAMIGPGSRTAWYVIATRTGGFTGPIKVEVKGLPEGVTVNPLTIQAGQTQGLLVLSADANAKQGASLVTVTGTATLTRDGKQQEVVRPVIAGQEIYFPGGGRGTFDVETFGVAVTDASDILDVKVTPASVVLKPGGEIKLEVELKRKPTYKSSVSLSIVLDHLGRVFGNTLPTGVTVVSGKSKTLLGGASKGHITLRAAPNAPLVENVPISVLAHVSINFVVKVSYSSAPIMVSVRK